jgi:predicted transcriptional regulator
MTVHEFVEYAKQQKIVSIDNLAEDYQRPSHQVQKRIQKLVDSCRLTGIIDGDKFIYMTNEELTLLANYILEREEVSLQELAKSTGSLIKL